MRVLREWGDALRSRGPTQATAAARAEAAFWEKAQDVRVKELGEGAGARPTALLRCCSP